MSDAYMESLARECPRGCSYVGGNRKTMSPAGTAGAGRGWIYECGYCHMRMLDEDEQSRADAGEYVGAPGEREERARTMAAYRRKWGGGP